MRLVAVVALLIAPATCWRGSARHTRHRDLKDLLLQRAVQTQLAQFHEQCAPPDEVKAEWLYRFHGNERLRSTSASGQLHALDALAVGAGDEAVAMRVPLGLEPCARSSRLQPSHTGLFLKYDATALPF